ncbi:MAG TPA: glycosyltransferase [Acidimicrobiia bacterium]|nr:glycosyltransferase [Acidimicrobiia bacterium]
MPSQRVAMISVHTSPLAQPGAGDGGGMNVYVRSLASNLARAGVHCDVLTRAEHAEQPPLVEVEPGFRVVHLAAGPTAPVPKQSLPDLVEPFVDAALAFFASEDDSPQVLHANYWISGAVGHRLKHALDLPLVATFHTLDRVKAEAGVGDDPATRARVEGEIINCADLVIAATNDERRQLVTLYGADRDRIEIVPPGVDHRVFVPGDRKAARLALRLDPQHRVLLYVGRIQRLKGADLAVRTLAELDSDVSLLVVGGPSGNDGEAEMGVLRSLVADLDLDDRVRFVPAQPHDRLVTYYQAADVCLVPSRTESFGLVALEAAACGTPVVAADVGGLRSVVDDGHTGFLVEGRAAVDYAAPVDVVLSDLELARAMGTSALARSGRYLWSIAAARLRRLYGDLATRAPVECS